MLLDKPHSSSSGQLEAVASVLLALSVWAVLMSLYSIATEYNGPLEAAHGHTDNKGYDKLNCYAASQPSPSLDLSGQLLGCL